MLKTGYIDYLNCYPLYHDFFLNYDRSEYSVIKELPSELNRLVKDAKLDFSPISAACYAAMQYDLSVLPDFCLSSDGYVKSVLLISKEPIENLNNSKIGLTSASNTSIILLKIILEKYYNISPCYYEKETIKNISKLDAYLSIGNEALSEYDKNGFYIYDLGEMWKKFTGYPVVFAIFVIRKDSLKNKENLCLIDRLRESFLKSFDILKNSPGIIINSAAEKYPSINTDLNQYYEIINYNFDLKQKNALDFFFEEAESLNLLPGVKKVNYY